MIQDVSGTLLIPGNFGNDCPGNGRNPEIECCCDECDYMLCCLDAEYEKRCVGCVNRECPRNAEWQSTVHRTASCRSEESPTA